MLPSELVQVLKLIDGDSDAIKWARSQLGVSDTDSEKDYNAVDIDDDEEDYSVVTLPEKNDIQSYIKLALLDVTGEDDDDAMSISSDFIAANMSLEEYMKGRWSRSSSLTEDGDTIHGGNSRIFV